MHPVISAIEISYYPLGAQVMTLVLPLGCLLVVLIWGWTMRRRVP